MQEFQSILNDVLLGTEFFSALVGFLYLYKLRNSYWKWFSIYLILVFIQEYFWIGNNKEYNISVLQYYAFFGVPLQYIFMYWLYAFKSLKNKRLFSLSSAFYLTTIYAVAYFSELNSAYSLSTTVGTLILIVLVVLEFIKQIKNDNILKFKENKMFYINIALVLFYIGTYPFHVFGDLFYKDYPEIWNIYYIYFLTTNCIMYLLFAASFIWGKQQS